MTHESPLRRLAHTAQLDGYELRRAESAEQYRAWNGALGLFKDGHFRFAGDVDSCRAWLHHQSLVRL